MVLIIPSVGAIILLVLVAYFFLGAPTGSIKSLLLTAINIVIVLLIVFFILSLLKIV